MTTRPDTLTEFSMYLLGQSNERLRTSARIDSASREIWDDAQHAIDDADVQRSLAESERRTAHKRLDAVCGVLQHAGATTHEALVALGMTSADADTVAAAVGQALNAKLENVLAPQREEDHNLALAAEVNRREYMRFWRRGWREVKNAGSATWYWTKRVARWMILLGITFWAINFIITNFGEYLP